MLCLIFINEIGSTILKGICYLNFLFSLISDAIAFSITVGLEFKKIGLHASF
jgi:hypothetical protein